MINSYEKNYIESINKGLMNSICISNNIKVPMEDFFQEITNFLKENKLLVIMIIGYLVLSKTKETFTSTFDKDINEIKVKKKILKIKNTDYDKDIIKMT